MEGTTEQNKAYRCLLERSETSVDLENDFPSFS